MKETVDLTLRRDFRKDRITNISDIIKKNTKIPWKGKTSELFTSGIVRKTSNEIFYTGDKKERNRKRMCNENKNTYDITCHCCGDIIKKYPWSEEKTLCVRCEDELRQRFNKYPWDDVHRRNK